MPHPLPESEYRKTTLTKRYAFGRSPIDESLSALEREGCTLGATGTFKPCPLSEWMLVSPRRQTVESVEAERMWGRLFIGLQSGWLQRPSGSIEGYLESVDVEYSIRGVGGEAGMVCWCVDRWYERGSSGDKNPEKEAGSWVRAIATSNRR